MLANRDIAFSIFFHGALVLLAVLWKPEMRPSPINLQPLPVELVPISELTKLMRKPVDVEKEEPEKAKDPVKKEVEAKPKPSVQQPQEVKPIKQVTADKDLVPDIKQTAEKQTVENTKVETPVKDLVVEPEPPKKPIFDISQVRLLLDKTPDDPVSDQPDMETSEPLTLSEIDSFRAQIKRCWSVPAGAQNGETLIIRVKLSLTSAGMISSGPVVVNREQMGNPFFVAAAESVLRAISRCQPFTMPVEKFKSWRDLDLTFDPSQMLGG
jgi:hypothetical protein